MASDTYNKTDATINATNPTILIFHNNNSKIGTRRIDQTVALDESSLIRTVLVG